MTVSIAAISEHGQQHPTVRSSGGVFYAAGVPAWIERSLYASGCSRQLRAAGGRILAAAMVGEGLVLVDAIKLSVGVLVDAAPKSRMMANHGRLYAAGGVL